MAGSQDLRGRPQCLFTGKPTNSSEHVIPRWLQARFDLGEQSMIIPNGSALKYKLHKVPADRDANNKFGEIEERISRGIYNLDEVHLWALKIHIGCIYRDASLRVDIKDTTSEFILDVSDFEHEVQLFQLLFQNWSRGGATSPSPFGSVFVLDSLYPSATFDFMHCLTTGTVGINVGDKFILVFLWDRGAAQQSNILDIWRDWHVANVLKLLGTDQHEAHSYMAHHVWACESAYGAYRRRRPHRIAISERQITLTPSLFSASPKPFDGDEYRRICRNFGLDLIHTSGETDNKYAQLLNVRFQKP